MEEKKKRIKRTINERIVRLEDLIIAKKMQAEKLSSDIMNLNEKIADLREQRADMEYASLRKLMESKGITPEEVLSMLK
jgi:chromosome segregation ATPase